MTPPSFPAHGDHADSPSYPNKPSPGLTLERLKKPLRPLKLKPLKVPYGGVYIFEYVRSLAEFLASSDLEPIERDGESPTHAELGMRAEQHTIHPLPDGGRPMLCEAARILRSLPPP
ncbi:uncharacterized protein TRAVEDRAFT_52978 [Trametes versicolor FP-101664 SS1]|uniref:uncharacterized protein n=1 Tax=Trametes versicolor (strain FP-101664) TaxID=717944 RepID=UPI0004622B2E|nr:uncharacterized protein TRAVEDRAFT_52978 [Trametes versicolor FP-101664 SS1]EIW52534.1 hypothetical protein TRAVEDRAFT_52978 [Trametes versicolor FP-101664 SS1]